MIDQLRAKIARGELEFSLHAARQMISRNISVQEVLETVLAGEVIEDYPDDKYGQAVCSLDAPRNGGRCMCIARIRAVRSLKSSLPTSRPHRNGMKP